MAVLALLNEYVLFNSVNLSDHVRAATVTAEASALDSTAMGDSWTENTGGLKSGTLTIEVLDDFAAGSIDATIWAAFNTGTAVAVAVKAVNDTITTSNPEYQFNVLPNQWSAGGSLNEMASKSLTYPITGAITRDVVA
jgi:hypothetical protein